MYNSKNSALKCVVASVFILLLLPFSVAETSPYENAQKKFLGLKEELKECEDADDDCEDIEEELLDAAIPYLKEALVVMETYFKYAGKETSAFEDARDELQYVDSKEEYDTVLSSVKTAWSSAASSIKQKTVEDLFATVEALVDKGEIIDAKLECGIDALESSTTTLDDSYASFAADIQKADEQLDAVEDLLEKKDLDSAVAGIRKAQEALKSSQASLTSARDALTAKGGALCADVVIEKDDEEEQEAEEGEEEQDAKEEAEEEVEEEKDLDELLNEYDLESYYEEAEDAIETLVEYIEEKQDDGYDTSKADAVLAQAEQYLEDAEELILKSGGTGAISRLLNAVQTAERGMNSEYYKAGSRSSSSGSGSADYEAFVDCMEGASYSYQRDACYEDYGIDGDTQTEIEECLDAANTSSEREECYAEAADEAQAQEGEDEESLRERLAALEDDLDALEEDVTGLYDELSDSGESSTSDDYKDVDSAIDALLDEVQEVNQGYFDDMDDIETKIDLGDESEADDLLDDLEDEIADYVEDMEGEIADIQQDIDAL